MSPYIHINPDYDYRVEFRKVKNPSLEFNSGQMTMVLPKGAKPNDVIQKYAPWIGLVHSNIQSALKVAWKRELENRTQQQFRELVWRLAEKISAELGVGFYKIRLKKMEKKWGSCGTDGNLTFNTLMRRLPENFIEYVVFHEVAHRKHMNHGKHFWRIVSGKYPAYKNMEMSLFVYWLMVEKIASPD